MRRAFVPCLLVALVLISFPGTASEVEAEHTLDELRSLELQLGGMLGQLTNLEDVRPVFKRHSENLFSLSVELTENENRRLVRKERLAKDTPLLLAVGHQAGLPISPAALSNPVQVNFRSILNFWWAVYNSGVTTEATTQMTVKGAGRVFMSREGVLEYKGGSITLFWEGKNVPLQKPGLYTQRVRLSPEGSRGTQSRKTQFLVR